VSGTWAVVPFKGPGGKRRLAPALDEEERYALARAMLEDVLAALAASEALDSVLVVTPDESVGQVVERHRALRPPEPPSADGLNDALAHAQHLALANGVGRLLVVPADVPLLEPGDVRSMLRAGDQLRTERYAVAAPNATRTGTNALLLCPPDVLPTRFGPDSFVAHREEAASRGAAFATVERPGLVLDVDRPEDIAAVMASGEGHRKSETLRFLRSVRRPRSLS
jgi:2-phospho-L-lactate/phosphoenolpyruvate guanylyltransferase